MRQRLTFRQGEQLSATKLNELAKQAFPGRGTGYNRASGIVGSNILIMEVLTIDNIARTIDCIWPGSSAEPEKTIYEVQLPKLFTETTRGIFTYTYSSLNARQSDDGATTEDQEITPNIIIGDEVLVMQHSTETDFRWLGDGRMWAAV